ncbi:MAG: hypothetical protein ACXWOL_10530, partial [Ktedonobacteraceae bacterium]
MSTRNADLEKEQNASQGAPGTIFNEDTIQLEKASPPPNAPQPPKHTAHNRRNFWLAITAVVIVMALIFSVLAVFIVQPGKQPSTQVTPTATAPSTTSTTTPGSDTTPAPAPGVTNGPQNGPSGVNTAAYWDTILGTKDTNGKVESVSFANVMGNSTLQALVTVRHSDANSTLDVYVFDKITSKNPVKIFTLDGLMKGQAKISYYNSIMTAEVDQNSTVNAGKTVSQMTPDLYREFAWSNGSMAQVAFPGIFPDLTRYQAEADQARVNAGHDPWKNDPKQVSLKFVGTYINWKYPLTATVTSGGGSHDVNATVKVQQEVPGIPQGSKPSLTVTLSRLEGNTHNMWVVIALDKGSALLTSIQPRSLVASPVKLEGKGSTFEQDLGEAYILDHTYTKVGHAHLTSTPNKNDVPYSVLVSYDTSFKAGPQEGIVEVQQSNPMGTGPVPVVMVKVLLDPQPRVALGPIFCPLALQNGAGPLGLSGLEPSCGNLKGNASLQALVVRDGSATVFDNITNARPTQIFTMKTQYARISGVSTIITKDGDLYREFKWSGTAGTFVQVIFPGMFPDMTRWQAEQSQSAVMAGQNTWKLDPVQTTQHWNLIAGTAKLVKGGGPNDLTAVVNVTYPDKGGPTTNIPVTQVTLQRLDG